VLPKRRQLLPEPGAFAGLFVGIALVFTHGFSGHRLNSAGWQVNSRATIQPFDRKHRPCLRTGFKFCKRLHLNGVGLWTIGSIPA
jgi:hypothetical protein